MIFYADLKGIGGVSIDESAKAALEALENKIIPVQTVSSTVKSALTTLHDLSASVPSQVTSYLSQLKSLASAQVGSQSYTYTSPSGKIVTISSHFLDGETVNMVVSLSKEIQNASPPQNASLSHAGCFPTPQSYT